MKQTVDEPDRRTIGLMIRAVVFVAFLAAFLVPTGVIPIISVASEGSEGEASLPGPAIIPLAGSTPVPSVEPADPTPHVPHVGIIAGHTGSDSGAVCPDGLQEVQINTEIARRVVALLNQRGWQADLLDEFDVRLNGYQADALISIHADSCTYPGKSGFKVARAESSYIPGDEDRLVACLSRFYQARTGLAFDANTITYDMTRYHAYYEINQNTPAAIIEAGFMLDDRELLVERPEVVAQGIVDGLICFVEGEEVP